MYRQLKISKSFVVLIMKTVMDEYDEWKERFQKRKEEKEELP